MEKRVREAGKGGAERRGRGGRRVGGRDLKSEPSQVGHLVDLIMPAMTDDATLLF